MAPSHRRPFAALLAPPLATFLATSLAPSLAAPPPAPALLAGDTVPLGAAPRSAPPPRAALPAAGPADPADPAEAALAGRLEGMLEPVRRRHGLPALAAAVVVAGRIEAAGAVGRRRIDAPIPVTIHDRFHIGSDTKAMTALLAAIAVERGLLRWDSRLGEVFPELRGVMAPAVAAVTLRQLLSHASGIGDATLEASLAVAARQPGNLDAQRLAMVGQIVRQPLLSPPGSRFQYGNHNYVLAGAMLERRQRRTWEELIQEQLFAPLGLRSAGLGPAARSGLTDAPLGHERRDGRLRPLLAGPNADNPAVLGPAGLAHLSLLDFARWAGWNAGQGRRGPALVPAATLRLLHTPVIGTDPADPREGYALGWGVAPLPGGAGPLLSHDGSNTMNLARVLVDPGRDLAVVLSTNVAGPEALAAFAELAPRLLELAAAWP